MSLEFNWYYKFAVDVVQMFSNLHPGVNGTLTPCNGLSTETEGISILLPVPDSVVVYRITLNGKRSAYSIKNNVHEYYVKLARCTSYEDGTKFHQFHLIDQMGTMLDKEQSYSHNARTIIRHMRTMLAKVNFPME